VGKGPLSSDQAIGGGTAAAHSPHVSLKCYNAVVLYLTSITLGYERANHQICELFVSSCTDPQSCRQQIVEDFKNETPLWKLTCYAHLRRYINIRRFYQVL
jgi:hypothetical protein